MPLKTREFNLSDEVDRLTEEMEEYAQTQAEAPFGSDAAQQAAGMGQRAERFRSGLNWAIEEWGVESITFSAHTSGERHRVRDVADEIGAELSDAYVAAGTYEAPYLEHDPEAIKPSEIRNTAKNVVDAHPAFVDWAESKISDLARVDGDTGKSYRALVLERRIQASSPSESG
jgi:hypothetical protein